MNPPDHTKFIVSWLGIISLACIGTSATLIFKGFSQGELLVGIASAATGSLGTMLAMRRSTNTPPSVTDPTTVETTTTESKTS